MNITYRETDFDSLIDCELLAGWYNDPKIKHLYSLFSDAKGYETKFTAEYFQRTGGNYPIGVTNRNLIVLLDGVPIGQATFEIDTPKLLTRTQNTAWLALVIGSDDHKRKGIGKEITKHLEYLAAEAGAERIEIGVFEYNHRALSFFTSQGYLEFTRRENRVWWDGKMWSIVQLLKEL